MPMLSNEMAMAVNEFLVSLPFYKIMLTAWIALALGTALRCISLQDQIERLQRQIQFVTTIRVFSKPFASCIRRRNTAAIKKATPTILHIRIYLVPCITYLQFR